MMTTRMLWNKSKKMFMNQKRAKKSLKNQASPNTPNSPTKLQMILQLIVIVMGVPVK